MSERKGKCISASHKGRPIIMKWVGDCLPIDAPLSAYCIRPAQLQPAAVDRIPPPDKTKICLLRLSFAVYFWTTLIAIQLSSMPPLAGEISTVGHGNRTGPPWTHTSREHTVVCTTSEEGEVADKMSTMCCKFCSTDQASNIVRSYLFAGSCQKQTDRSLFPTTSVQPKIL